MKKLQIILDRI